MRHPATEEAGSSSSRAGDHVRREPGGHSGAKPPKVRPYEFESPVVAEGGCPRFFQVSDSGSFKPARPSSALGKQGRLKAVLRTCAFRELPKRTPSRLTTSSDDECTGYAQAYACKHTKLHTGFAQNMAGVRVNRHRLPLREDGHTIPEQRRCDSREPQLTTFPTDNFSVHFLCKLPSGRAQIRNSDRRNPASYL